MLHFDDRRDALSRAEPEHGHLRLCRHRIAVERNDAEDMAGESEAADFGRARIQHMEQHPFAPLYADRVAVPEHPAIDAEQVVAHLESFGFLLRFLVGGLPICCSVLSGAPASTSMAISPPRLNAGANSFITRKTSRS